MKFTGCRLLLKPLALHIRKERFSNFEEFASKKTEMIDREQVPTFHRRVGIRGYRYNLKISLLSDNLCLKLSNIIIKGNTSFH